ncbi:YtxH domain-containing protein [Telluribacter sp. SYSU D00476]|uniref:YtxH domain-containing protein n=1 Tax=Telluribacter sp. SYSU D00476 TaxID=2811430 RepID=UPI001FF132E3|nr:YtxH domain-containing protein [Telluribacter sp. SYSU D00476]
MTSNQRFVMGTLGATLAGVAVGVLMAPKKGTETRNMIKTRANDLSSNAKSTFEKNYSTCKDYITNMTDKVKSQFNSMSNGMTAGHTGDNVMGNDKSAGTSRRSTHSTSGSSTSPGGVSTSGTTDKFNQNS